MSILTRVTRICRADIHGVMDQLEDRGLLLNQYLREMETELERKETRLEQIMASREQAQQEYLANTREREKVEQDLAMAIEKDKDDIARFLIKKLKPLTHHQEELSSHIEALDREITQFRQTVEEQRFQYEQLQLKSREYFHKTERQQWEQTLSPVIPGGYSQELSEEEVELELLRRKESIKGGTKK